jgi:hypothetical protein
MDNRRMDRDSLLSIPVRFLLLFCSDSTGSTFARFGWLSLALDFPCLVSLPALLVVAVIFVESVFLRPVQAVSVRLADLDCMFVAGIATVPNLAIANHQRRLIRSNH